MLIHDTSHERKHNPPPCRERENTEGLPAKPKVEEAADVTNALAGADAASNWIAVSLMMPAELDAKVVLVTVSK